MRKTFIEMGLNLVDLTPVHDTFNGVISRQLSTPIRHIDLEVSCGSRDNKCREMLTFKVTSFDIGYNCILGRPFILKFMSVIHTVYATMKISNMHGIPREVIEHKLEIDPLFKPIKQKERRYTTEMHETIRQGVNRLLEVGFIRLVDYLGRLANLVLIEKDDGSWRMCIDYTSLNKEYPKYESPLSHICQIVDSTTSCKLLSFLDAYSGNHQISLTIDDEEKQLLSPHLESYHLGKNTKMVFGLKNRGATYQKGNHIILENQIGQNIEANIDDVVVK
jgi:hypothetical protein